MEKNSNICAFKHIRRPSHFITKFLCMYVLNAVIIGTIRAMFTGFYTRFDTFSTIAYTTSSLLYYNIMWSLFFALIWNYLENNKPTTKIIKFRNIFVANFFANVCGKLIAYIAGATPEKLLDFYTYTFLECWVVYLAEPWAEKWLKRNAAIISTYIEKIYLFIFYWAFAVIFISWTPFMDNLYVITMPILAISAPIGIFVGHFCDVACTIVVIYMLKQFVQNKLLELS